MSISPSDASHDVRYGNRFFVLLGGDLSIARVLCRLRGSFRSLCFDWSGWDGWMCGMQIVTRIRKMILI
eukprot:scaffold7101_cov153-Amphora_coffeaeformis.AAC.17